MLAAALAAGKIAIAQTPDATTAPQAPSFAELAAF